MAKKGKDEDDDMDIEGKWKNLHFNVPCTPHVAYPETPYLDA